MMSIRDKFVEVFGEEQAKKLEEAANQHQNSVNGYDKGSDPFKWVIAICLGYECAQVDRYKEYHGINIDTDKFETWVKENAELATHDGDIDYLSAAVGIYNKYL